MLGSSAFEGANRKTLLVLSFSGFETHVAIRGLWGWRSRSPFPAIMFSLGREGFLTVHPLRLLGKYTPAGRHFIECSLYG